MYKVIFYKTKRSNTIIMIKNWLSQIPIFFKWYFSLESINRIQFNYIAVVVILISAIYINDSKHKENYNKLSDRFDSINHSRYKEQEAYTANLRFYTDKFNGLLERLLEQKQKIEEIQSENELNKK